MPFPPGPQPPHPELTAPTPSFPEEPRPFLGKDASANFQHTGSWKMLQPRGLSRERDGGWGVSLLFSMHCTQCDMHSHLPSPARRCYYYSLFTNKGAVICQEGQSQDPILTQTLNHQASPGGSRSSVPRFQTGFRGITSHGHSQGPLPRGPRSEAALGIGKELCWAL